MEFFVLESRDLWGDYGWLLINGCVDDDNPTDLLILDRAGPFVPPVVLPVYGFHPHLAVSNSFRKQLELSGLGSFAFRSTRLGTVVDIPWHTWDFTLDSPPDWPESGEPDDYFDRPHSSDIASQIEPIWEVQLKVGAEFDYEFVDEEKEVFGIKFRGWRNFDVPVVHLDTWNQDDIFFGGTPDLTQGIKVVVTTRARDWLMQYAGEWVRFKKCKIV